MKAKKDGKNAVDDDCYFLWFVVDVYSGIRDAENVRFQDGDEKIRILQQGNHKSQSNQLRQSSFAVMDLEKRRQSEQKVKNNGNFLGMCNQELLAQGSELLKRTHNGDLYWKIDLNYRSILYIHVKVVVLFLEVSTYDFCYSN
ncbi:VAN3-binding protein [Artemisia annua]|uniref:VAN3-binding protein n=1 Tax=Artemisia annua TaxID=35608 RepID=A0A2U1MQW1_ARTAN|nr:VAN3-binding protein [Artemisia annua]